MMELRLAITITITIAIAIAIAVAISLTCTDSSDLCCGSDSGLRLLLDVFGAFAD